MKKKINILFLLIPIISLTTLAQYNLSNQEELIFIEDINLINDNTLELTPKKADYWILNFIYINNDNWSQNAVDWIQNHTGTENDPHIIENVQIYAGGSGSGIIIQNSNDYFIIRNCTIWNTENSASHAGIKVDNTKNGLLIQNNCSNNPQNGILLFNNCVNNTLKRNIIHNNEQNGIYLSSGCKNNTIIENTICNLSSQAYQQGIGIFIATNCDGNNIQGNNIKNNIYGAWIAGSDCEYNHIYYNEFTDNIFPATDNSGGAGNKWDNSIVGNYWSSYSDFDSDNNGIWDSPYTFDAPASDNYPLVNSPVHNGSKIHIDDAGISSWNWSKTALLKYWCSGSGTINDPYIVDNLDIDGGGADSCILIGNSSAHFTIQNCETYNAGIGSYDAGIKLESVGNGTIYSNNCSDNLLTGILLYNYCDDNIIINNTANDNGFRGIMLRYYCDDNLISNNTADSQDCGIQFHDNCDRNNITHNLLTRAIQNGILCWASDNTKILNNTVFDCTTDGIYLDSCYWNIIMYNNITYTSCGVVLDRGWGTTMSYNRILNEGSFGIFMTGLTTDYCTISNNYIENCSKGFLINSDCNGNNLISNTILNNREEGIRLFGTDNNNLLNNYIGNIGENIQEFGIYLDTGTQNVNITQNTLKNNKQAIYLAGACSQNFISNNEIRNNSYCGIQIYSNSNHNDIIYNTIAENNVSGIVINSSSGNIVLDNEIEENRISGIHLTNSDSNTLISNTIKNNYYAILMNNSDFNLINENILCENTECIIEDGLCDDNIKLDNICSDICPTEPDDKKTDDDDDDDDDAPLIADNLLWLVILLIIILVSLLILFLIIFRSNRSLRDEISNLKTRLDNETPEKAKAVDPKNIKEKQP